MPEFLPGGAKAAVAPIVVRPAELSCEAEIFLGPDEMTKVATSGRIPFVSTGVSQNVRLPLTMPAAEGTYHVYVDVYAEGYLIAAYQAIEDVVVVAIPSPFTFSNTSIVKIACALNPYCDSAIFQCRISNPANSPVTHTLTLWRQRYSMIWGEWSLPVPVLLFNLTLEPGASYDYELNGCQTIPGSPPHVTYIQVYPGNKYDYWLQDEDGNKSSVVTVYG